VTPETRKIKDDSISMTAPNSRNASNSMNKSSNKTASQQSMDASKSISLDMRFPEFFLSHPVRRTQANIPGVALRSAKGCFVGGSLVLSLDSITDSINGSLNS
jgi:hypothetical protein